jgi:hypothetical protein
MDSYDMLAPSKLVATILFFSNSNETLILIQLFLNRQIARASASQWLFSIKVN